MTKPLTTNFFGQEVRTKVGKKWELYEELDACGKLTEIEKIVCAWLKQDPDLAAHIEAHQTEKESKMGGEKHGQCCICEKRYNENSLYLDKPGNYLCSNCIYKIEGKTRRVK